METGSGDLFSGSADVMARWLPILAVAGVAFASGILVTQIHVRSASTARRNAVGIIPARYKSARFEGKPLALILGKPMIQCATRLLLTQKELVAAARSLVILTYLITREVGGVRRAMTVEQFNLLKAVERTWEQAKLASALDYVVVATDDNRIADCCRTFGAQVVMTPETCANGTERCKEALKLLKKKYDIVVNIQGDEPLIDPEIINGVVRALQTSPDANFSTAVTDLKPEDAHDPNRVKCVVDQNGYAIYFSRGMLPFNKTATANPDFPYLLHLGIQCYDAKLLATYPKMRPTPLQLEEDLEQLKVLENGHKMKIIKVDHSAHGVDVPSDIQSIEALMRASHLT